MACVVKEGLEQETVQMLLAPACSDDCRAGRALPFESERATREQGLRVGVGKEGITGDDRRHCFSE